ncbi:hypothetical protein BDV30DRAFT_165834 [Aspergillus minisclerotigenes]|uniref:Uncharacterized protein n=1 Tax=Aspergillus minisclerotigenes TaxID=656917 RepID=A0A5N6IWX4_9EURO|nr:hypothetical protein BDV30DRAFT_165834 [Aspergillus minisclerotigenes]
MDLQRAWLGGHLSQDQKIRLVREIAGYIDQLRSLEPPQKEIVGSASLEAGLDYRIGFFPFGPFYGHEEFIASFGKVSLWRTPLKYLAKRLPTAIPKLFCPRRSLPAKYHHR